MTDRLDMTQGSLWNKILRFALPLALSSTLQQLFNSADTAVVGHFVGSQALAAVGSNAPVINLQICLFIDLSTGANVLIARQLGAQEKEQVSRSVHTVMALALASGFLTALIGNLCSRLILEWMHTPEDVIDLAALYLHIYFLGMPFFMVYNFGSAILRSKGDTKRPMYCLLASGIVNVLLNLFFVIVVRLGVAGVAIATVLSNALAASCVWVFLVREEGPLRFSPGKMRIEKRIFRETARIGIPSAVQSSVFSLSNILIVSSVGSFGSAALAGNATAGNFDGFVFFVINSFIQACVTFTSQNYGAGNVKRMKRVFRLCIGFSFLMSALMCGFFALYARELSSLYTTDSQVLDYAQIRLHTAQPWQWLSSGYDVTAAAMRGIGYSMLPSVLTIFGIVGFRIFWISTVFARWHDFTLLIAVYPITWLLTTLLMLFCYRHVSKKVYARIEGKPKESLAQHKRKAVHHSL